MSPQHHIEEILFDRDAINQRIKELAQQIADDYGAGTDLMILPILTGSFIFAADLVRQLPNPIRIEWLRVRSYPGKSTASQGPVILGDLPQDLKNQQVLLVDDILDTGKTLSKVMKELQQQAPAQLKSAVLLHKNRDEAPICRADYTGFEVPDRFVVGYGLDYDDYYRNIDQIVTLKSL